MALALTLGAGDRRGILRARGAGRHRDRRENTRAGRDLPLEREWRGWFGCWYLTYFNGHCT